MKKILKTLAKKSMSLFMAVVMLLSCWVFFVPAPEAHAAQETLTYTLQQLYDTYLTEDPGAVFVKGKFTHDNTVPAQDGLYQNVLYSPDYTNGITTGVAYVGSQLGVDGCDSGNYNKIDVYWHHAETVMLWDGVTTPRTGVMVVPDPGRSGDWDGSSTVERVWMRNSNLSHPSYWKGICGANLDFTWAMTQGDQLNYLSTTTNSAMKITRTESDTVPVYANYMQYTGSMDSSKFIDNILPEFSIYVYDTETSKTLEAKSNTYVRVVNYKSLKDAIVAAKDQVKIALDAAPNYYTEASLQELQTLANALVAAKPDTTFFDAPNGVCKYNEYAADALAAVSAWNNRGGLKVNKFVVTFKDAQGTVATEEVLYGGKATAPAARAKAADNSYHYSFSKWDKTFDNVTENMTVTAEYTGVAHIHEGAFEYKDGTHARACTVCGNIGWNGKGGEYVPCDGTWGGNDSSHTMPCSICGNTQTHTPNFVEVKDDKYQIAPGSDYNACEDNIYYYKSCSICGQAHSTDKFVGVAAKGEHVYDTFTGHTNHTCTEDGYDTYLCSNCGQATTKRYDTVNGQPGTDPKAHNWNNKLAIYSDTQHGYQCRVEGCGVWNMDSLADHSYSAPTGSAIETRPTCYQPGKGTYKCSCGHTYVGEIPATGEHNYNTNKLVEIDENTHGYRCRTTGCPAYQIADDGSEKHVWTLTSTITEPTCSQEGLGNYKCNLCGATKEDTIAINPDAHNHDTVISDLGNGTHGYKCLNAPNDPNHAKDVAAHDYDEYVKYDDNQHTFYCETCNTWDNSNLTPHVWSLDETLTAPTCSEEGWGAYSCSCGATKEDVIAIDPTAHSYGEIVDLGDGTHGKVCAYNSGHKIEVAAHIWELESVITPQTCVNNGSGNYKCTACDATKVDVIEADGKSHNYLDPESDGNGKHTASCSYCNDDIEEACFDNNNDCICDVCGYKIPCVFVNKVDEDYFVSAADCNSYAVYKKSCSVCGTAHATETFEDVEAGYADHKWENSEERLATPAECGKDETYYKYCSECKKYADEVDHHIPAEKTWTKTGTALEHNYTAKADNSNIVCNNDGTHKYYCQNDCGTTGGEVECNFGDYTYDDNNHYRECADCKYIEKTAHTLTEWKYDDAEAEHYHGKHCEVCEYKTTEACDYEEVYTAAVCEQNAYTTYTCKVATCEHSYTVIHENTALEHIFEAKEGYIVNNENGTHSYKCSRDCGEVSEPVDCEITYTQNEDNLKHTALCGVCGYTYEEACAGGTAYCNKLAVCDLCEEEYGAFDPANHGIEEGINTTRRDNEVEATCVIPGHTADVVCNGCNAIIEKGEDLPVNPDNHKNFTGTMAGTLPTCTEAGYADSKFCLDCKKSIGDGTIPALGHKFDGDIVKGVDADGIEYHEYKCTTAIYKLADGSITTEMPAEGTAYEVVYSCDKTGKREACSGGEATCSELAECKVCGQEYGEYSAHNFNGDFVQVEDKKEHYRKCEYCDAYGLDGEEGKTAKCTGFFATCEEDSMCVVCGGIYMTALGHDFENSEVVNCLDNGKHTFKCLRCDVVSEEFECADAEPVKTEATCTEGAYFTYICDDCGYKWVVESTDPADAAKGHDYTEVQTNAAHLETAATCTEKAVYWYDCSRCTKNAKDETDTEKYTELTFEFGEAAGHKYDGKEYLYKATDATCTENETYYKHCSACADKPSSEGTEFEATFEKFGTKIEHDWKNVVDEDYLVSEATCTSKAVYNVSCENCDAVGSGTFTDGDLKAHEFKEEIKNYAHIVTKANCQTAATYWYDCKTCAMSASLEAPEKPVQTEEMTDEEYAELVEAYEEALAALQFTDGQLDPNTHTKLTKVPALLPTCTVDGHSAYEVCECGVKFGYETEGYEATGHDFTGDYTFNAETDKHTRLCANGCGAADENEVACTFSKWTQVEGTETHTRFCVCGNTETEDCVAEGAAPSCVEKAKCKDCQGYVGETSEHSFTGEYVQTKNAEGKDAHYKKCANCAAYGLQETVQDEEGNDVVVNVEGKSEACAGGEATCHDKAICDTCKKAYGDQPDHDFGEWYDDAKRPATCLTNGWQLAKCKNCEEIKEKELIGSACGHEMGTWTYADEADKPTCKDEGMQTRYCTCKWTLDGKEITCDYKETQVVPTDPTLHVEGEWVKDEGSADCVTGITWYLYCEVCNKKLDSKLEKGEHKWEETAVVAATCTEDGYIDYRCELCGFTNTEYPEELKSEGHAWGEEVIDKAATCGAAGRAYQICIKCNGMSEKYAIPATGHGPTVTPEYTIIVEPVAATCSSTGHNGYWKCKRCSYDEHLDENSDYKVFPKLPHKDTDGDGLCDECRGKIYADDSGSNKSCGCMCHNDSWLMQFFYKIAKFFWKLFGTNKSCACGYVHY